MPNPPLRQILKSGSALLALLAALPATAQETAEEPFRLAPILVNEQAEADDDAASTVAKEMSVGGKIATSIQDTPASVSVITNKEITARKSDTLEEVLQYTASTLTDYYGTDDRNDYFTIRGFQATTYRDGLTLGSMRGVREEPYAYERIEVLRGANSTLFGAADPGGSVNFVTKQPKFERLAETQVTYGSHNHKELGFDFGNVLNSTETLAFRVTGKLQDSGLEYDSSRDDETFLMGGLTWAPSSNTSFSVIAEYLNRDGTPNSGGYPLDKLYDRESFYGEPTFNDHDVDRKSLTGLLRHDFGTGLTLRSSLRYSDLTDDFGYIYLSDSAARTGTTLNRYYFGTDRSAEELIGNAILQYDTTLGVFDSSTLAGIEFRDATTRDTSIYGTASTINLANPVYTGGPANPNVYARTKAEYQTKSVFATQNLSWNDRWIATLGARHDWLDLTSTNLMPATPVTTAGSFSESSGRAALTYKLNDQTSIYASYVESVAPPSIGVEPERGEQYELGVKYAPAGTNALVSASVYDLRKKDVTIAVVQPNGTIEREKVGQTRVRGFDLEAKAELNDRVSLTGSYSYLDSEVLKGTLRNGTSIAGKAFATTPNHIASLWTTYELDAASPYAGTSAGLGVRYVGAYFFDAANTKRSAAATLVDAALAYDVSESAAVELRVSNLFDEQHVVGSGTADYYNPGRELALTLRKTW